MTGAVGNRRRAGYNGFGSSGDQLGEVWRTACLCCRRPFVLGGPLKTLLIAGTLEPFLGTVPASGLSFITPQLLEWLVGFFRVHPAP